jgi:hypothetical protein
LKGTEGKRSAGDQQDEEPTNDKKVRHSEEPW